MGTSPEKLRFAGLLALLLLLFSAQQTHAAFTCTVLDTTCSALGDLYAATNGGAWNNNIGWITAAAGTATDYCTFYGVGCGSGVVTSLYALACFTEKLIRVCSWLTTVLCAVAQVPLQQPAERVHSEHAGEPEQPSSTVRAQPTHASWHSIAADNSPLRGRAGTSTTTS